MSIIGFLMGCGKPQQQGGGGGPVLPDNSPGSYIMTKRSDHVTDFVRDGSKAMQMGSYYYSYGGWTNLGPPDYLEATYNDVYRSTGDLTVWEKLPDAPWHARHCFGCIKKDGAVWVMGGDNLYSVWDVWKSTDGINWAQIPQVGPHPGAPSYIGCTTHVIAGVEWIYIVGGYGAKECWRSMDGSHWEKVADNLEFLADATHPNGAEFNNSLASLYGKLYVICGGGDVSGGPPRKEVWRSVDNGATWQRRADFPSYPRRYTDVLAWDNKIWVVNGYDDYEIGNLKSIWYMTDNEVWREFVTPGDYIGSHATGIGIYNAAGKTNLVITCGNWNNHCWVIEKQTVAPPVNLPPVVNAGIDQSITLPTSSVSVLATASDPDGSIASYLWTRTSGPNMPTFTTPAAAGTNVTGLIAGTYVLRCTVTDNSGSTAFDELTVVVAAAGGGPPTDDDDVNAFLSATGITDPDLIDALYDLTTGMKTAGIWAKMRALYPFIGGTAAAHKFNLVNPADTDGAFRLTFPNGATHTANGAAFDGVNQYADTHFSPVSQYADWVHAHVAVYARSGASGPLVNTQEPGYEEIAGIRLENTSIFHFDCFGGANNGRTSNFASQYTYGFFVGTRLNKDDAWAIHDGTTTAHNTATIYGQGLPTPNIKIASNYNLSAFTGMQVAFCSIGDGLTDTQANSLYTLVQAYQTALGRQV